MPARSTSHPPVSVVVVTWNSEREIGACLDALARSDHPGEIEVVVVDNASTDGTVAVLDARPDVRVVRSDRNGGFAAGSNLGLRVARAELVMLLNPDTEVDPGAIRRLAEHLESRPGVGMCGPLLVRRDGQRQRTSARLGPNLVFDLLHDGLGVEGRSRVGRSLVRRFQYPYDLTRTQAVEAISGAAMVMRRRALDEVGLLDEGYRHCGEDVDLCLRFRRAGWEVAFVPDAVVHHVSGASSSRAPARTTVEALLGRERFYRLNRSRRHAAAFRAILSGLRVPAMLGRGAARYLVRRDRDDLRQRVAVAGCLLRLRPYEDA